MDYGSMLSSLGFANGNGTNSNTLTWIIIVVIILFFGKPGFGFGLGGNVPVAGGAGGCCCNKHHHSHSCCRRTPAGIAPVGLGGYGGNEWLFIILILALVFLLNNQKHTEVEC